MKRFYHLGLLILMALATAVAAGPAIAQVTQETGPGYAGHVHMDLARGQAHLAPAPANTQALGDVYNLTNPASPANTGFSSTDLAAIMGDRVTTVGGGLLAQNDFTVYNAGTSAGNLLTASFIISFFDGATAAPLGSYLTAPVSFGTGLAPGFYSIITLTGLETLGILLPTTDLLITQQVSAFTGTASRLGIASLDPPSIGSSAPSMYISATTVGPPGYYNVGTINANPGYRVNVVNATPARTSTWGTLKNLYR